MTIIIPSLNLTSDLGLVAGLVTILNAVTASRAPAVSVPPIDAARPARTETATFALG